MGFWHWPIQELYSKTAISSILSVSEWGSSSHLDAVIDLPWFFLHFFGNPKAMLITYIIILLELIELHELNKHIWTPFSSLNPFFPRTIMCRLYLQSWWYISLPRPSKNPQRMVQVLNSWAKTPSLWLQTEGTNLGPGPRTSPRMILYDFHAEVAMILMCSSW